MAIFSAVTITYILRWIFVILSVLIVFECIYSLLSSKHTPETLGYFNIVEGEKIPITHWENVIGRSKSSDIKISSEAVSNTHALLIKKEKGWFIKDLNSNNGTYINGKSIKTSNVTEDDDIRLGDTIATIIPEPIPAIATTQPQLFSIFVNLVASLNFFVMFSYSSFALFISSSDKISSIFTKL